MPTELITTLTQLQKSFWQEHNFLMGHYQPGKHHDNYSTVVHDYFYNWLDEQSQYDVVESDVLDQATLTEE